jgi:hypothetical protein
MNKLLFIIVLLYAASAHAQDAWLPDPALTPGVTNPAVTQDNIKTTICQSGWTATIRPPASYTTALKKTQLTQTRYTDKNTRDFEEDHFLSLEIGGSPTDPQNLWPQPFAGNCGARVKDRIEGKLKRLVCAGTITLEEAQKAITPNWVQAYSKWVSPLECNNP